MMKFDRNWDFFRLGLLPSSIVSRRPIERIRRPRFHQVANARLRRDLIRQIRNDSGNQKTLFHPLPPSLPPSLSLSVALQRRFSLLSSLLSSITGFRSASDPAGSAGSLLPFFFARRYLHFHRGISPLLSTAALSGSVCPPDPSLLSFVHLPARAVASWLSLQSHDLHVGFLFQSAQTRPAFAFDANDVLPFLSDVPPGSVLSRWIACFARLGILQSIFLSKFSYHGLPIKITIERSKIGKNTNCISRTN